AVGFVILSSEESSRVGINTGTEKQLQCDSHASVASASQHSRSSVAWKPRTNHSRSFESNSSQPASPPSQQRNTEKLHHCRQQVIASETCAVAERLPALAAFEFGNTVAHLHEQKRRTARLHN